MKIIVRKDDREIVCICEDNDFIEFGIKTIITPQVIISSIGIEDVDVIENVVLPSDFSIGAYLYDSAWIRTLDFIKLKKVNAIKLYTRQLLADTDFYIVRRAETGKSVPQEILNARQAIRVWSDAQEKAVMALATLEEVITFQINY